jgi:hypothetical protein
LEVQYANDLMNRIYSAMDSTAKQMSQLWNCNFFKTLICYILFAAMQKNACLKFMFFTKHYYVCKSVK